MILAEARLYNPALGYAGTADIVASDLYSPPDGLTFDGETHTYTAGGRSVPSVTQVLKRVGLIDDRWVDEHALSRGRAVHAVIQYDLEGDLDEASIADEIRPYVDAWRRFRAETGGLKAGLIEVKTGASPPPWAALQLAAYALCLDGPIERYVLSLRPDGTYRLRQHTSPKELQTWLAVLQVYRWLEEHGPTTKEETIGSGE